MNQSVRHILARRYSCSGAHLLGKSIQHKSGWLVSQARQAIQCEGHLCGTKFLHVRLNTGQEPLY
jgi:hypothetical protein